MEAAAVEDRKDWVGWVYGDDHRRRNPETKKIFPVQLPSTLIIPNVNNTSYFIQKTLKSQLCCRDDGAANNGKKIVPKNISKTPSHITPA
jgi:hypothetical protein